MNLDAEHIARVCHEANRAYCATLGDDSQPPWESAPDWQKASAVQGVIFHMSNPDASPAESHESWCAAKVEDGWVYGETKDAEKKIHPCLLEWDQLPKEQRLKDVLFKSIVLGFVDFEIDDEDVIDDTSNGVDMPDHEVDDESDDDDEEGYF